MGRWFRGEVELDDDKVWKKSLSGKYWVSEHGDMVNSETGYRINPRVYEDGYVRVGDVGGKTKGLHRMVFEAFVGEIPKGMQVNHIDGVKTNNHISNLEVCTPAENTQHAYAMGLASGKSGQENSMAKLSEEDVLSMYGMFKLGYPNKIVGDKFGVHERYVSLVRHGKRWVELFEREGMGRTPSLGNLPFPLPKCVWAYNLCMNSDLPHTEVSKIVGVDPSTVSRIRAGKTWKAFHQFQNVECSACQ